MFLQILPADQPTVLETILENQTLLVVAGLAVGIFTLLKVVKLLNVGKNSRKTNNPSYS